MEGKLHEQWNKEKLSQWIDQSAQHWTLLRKDPGSIAYIAWSVLYIHNSVEFQNSSILREFGFHQMCLCWLQVAKGVTELEHLTWAEAGEKSGMTELRSLRNMREQGT